MQEVGFISELSDMTQNVHQYRDPTLSQQSWNLIPDESHCLVAMISVFFRHLFAAHIQYLSHELCHIYVIVTHIKSTARPSAPARRCFFASLHSLRLNINAKLCPTRLPPEMMRL